MVSIISEKTIENEIKKWLDSQKHWYFKVHGGIFQKSGVPDIIACIQGRFVGIELKKSKGGVISILQEKQMELIRDSGGITGVARSLEDFKKILEKGGITTSG